MAASPEVENPLSILGVTTGANILLLEQEREAQQISFKTGVKSIDAHFHRLWHGGSVVGIGQNEVAQDSQVRVWLQCSTKSY